MTTQKFHAALKIGHGLVTWLGIYAILIKKGVKKALWGKKLKQGFYRSVLATRQCKVSLLCLFRCCLLFLLCNYAAAAALLIK